MSNNQPDVAAQITILFLEDGSIDIHSNADLLTRIHMLKSALEHDLYTANMLLAKNKNGIPVS